MDTLDFLYAKLTQLKDRKTMVPRYLENPERWIGKRDYAANMLKGIDQDILETEAAINGIHDLRKEQKANNKTQRIN